jgi:hypothetical protein
MSQRDWRGYVEDMIEYLGTTVFFQHRGWTGSRG